MLLINLFPRMSSISTYWTTFNLSDITSKLHTVATQTIIHTYFADMLRLWATTPSNRGSHLGFARQPFLNKCAYLSKSHHLTKSQDHILTGASVVPYSQSRKPAMLVLFTVSN